MLDPTLRLPKSPPIVRSGGLLTINCTFDPFIGRLRACPYRVGRIDIERPGASVLAHGQIDPHLGTEEAIANVKIWRRLGTFLE